ncbi:MULTISPECIES: Rieske (2Fe-2S) protein [unclassified Corynebacterium]|uniref:Rieske (2Fe-2S) protein n=1 Tax=unclassified Corynebacterium TaxID=2624378 RepID=UPI001C479BD3|nr:MULTISPECIES: Rieske (2Fe-2S) protein [unclassified Corynebacterium]MBV7281449.1 Rieske (2Fe-2S) protein [Corynebacterium sp. TAE3-ERU30]MBV7301089.1 Rieske (2Fe-2S) protein [Corynebacterium sp. TAE3-ERU2]
MSGFDTSRFPCSRRSFLKGVAAATAATASGALLAACGSSETAAQVDSASVPVGGAVFVEGWVVAQPQEGVFTAYSATCPHAQGPIDHLEDVDGEQVAVCSKHMSKFSLADGSVIEGPSRDPMVPATIDKAGNELTVS